MVATPAIDAVFTWVDGANLPELSQWLQHVEQRGAAGDFGSYRWRDNGELRFALRSLETFAPWIRTVHLVTNGQVPAWLDRAVPHLRVVTHADIFPDLSVLPTFNSNAIEAVLHRIPDLADHYLYFNDDVLLGRPVTTEDFLNGDGGTLVRVDRWTKAISPKSDSLIDRQLARNSLLVLPHFAPLLSHSPQLFNRDRVTNLWERWEAVQRETLAHRFRSERDALLRTLYFTELLAEGLPHQALIADAHTIMLYRVTPESDIDADLKALESLQPLSWCFNDEIEDLDADGWRWERVRAFLGRRYPTPSQFER
jgi:hypothetical protein